MPKYIITETVTRRRRTTVVADNDAQASLAAHSKPLLLWEEIGIEETTEQQVEEIYEP